MNNPNHPTLPPANPETGKNHRAQSFAQILLPILLVTLILVAVAVLASLAPNDTVIRFSDISIMFLILPTAMVVLVLFLLSAGLIYGLAKALKVLPQYARLAQIYIEKFEQFLRKLSDKSVSPMITLESGLAGMRVLFHRDHQE
jgi:cytochrome bd-type quinol oxidase subunit 2